MDYRPQSFDSCWAALAPASAAEKDRQLVPDQLAERPVKTGGRLVKHARYWLLLAEGHPDAAGFGAILPEDWVRRLAVIGAAAWFSTKAVAELRHVVLSS